MAALLLVVSPAALLGADALSWTHFTIADPLPGEAWGTAGIPLADLDHDGDLDAALSRRDAHGFYWFERRSDSDWVRHVLSESEDLTQGLGAAAADFDGDGWADLAFSGVWFRNPGSNARQDGSWTATPFGGGGHDLVAVDLSGDRRSDLVTFDGEVLSWFDPAQGWASNVVARGIGHHGGVAPRGAGDLDNDGDADLVIAGAWFENPGDGRGDWRRHSWPHLEIPQASYGTSIRSWVADLDADGAQDIIYGDCDTGSGHVFWVRNTGRGEGWTRRQLPDPPVAAGDVPGTGSWHSLAVADFDGDGDLDVFGGEQEDPDTYMESGGRLPMKPRGLKERGVIWVNSGGPEPVFVPEVLHRDNPGWHDVSVGDVDADGDPDLVSKIWNKDGARYHADYWRNERIPTPPTARPFHLGFTRWPADLTLEGFVMAQEFAHAHGDVVSVMFIGGLPWPEALEARPFSPDVQSNLDYRPPAGRKLFLSVSPLDKDRKNLAPYWGEKDNLPLPPDWRGRALDSPEVRQAFLNFLVRSVEAMHPDYLAIGIESNVLLSHDRNKWEQLKRLHRATYGALKARYPKLPVFFTTEVLHYRQLASDARGSDQEGEVADLMNSSDLFAMSIYPHMSYDVPRPVPAGFLDFATRFGKPIAVSESGMTSRDVELKAYGLTLHGSEADQKQFTELLLRTAARDRYEFVVSFATTDFEKLCAKLPPPVDDLARIWAYTGLQTSDGKAKPALAVWDDWLRIPYHRMP